MRCGDAVGVKTVAASAYPSRAAIVVSWTTISLTP
jgi:hypothetical protein